MVLCFGFRLIVLVCFMLFDLYLCLVVMSALCECSLRCLVMFAMVFSCV